MGFCRGKCQKSEYIFYLLGFKASSDSGEIAPVRGLPISIIFADFTLYALHSKVICKSICQMTLSITKVLIISYNANS